MSDRYTDVNFSLLCQFFFIFLVEVAGRVEFITKFLPVNRFLINEKLDDSEGLFSLLVVTLTALILYSHRQILCKTKHNQTVDSAETVTVKYYLIQVECSPIVIIHFFTKIYVSL